MKMVGGYTNDEWDSGKFAFLFLLDRAKAKGILSSEQRQAFLDVVEKHESLEYSGAMISVKIKPVEGGMHVESEVSEELIPTYANIVRRTADDFIDIASMLRVFRDAFRHIGKVIKTESEGLMNRLRAGAA